MARPRKRRGYSPIVVDGRKLAWIVTVDSRLHVKGETNAGCLLDVDYGGFDPWLELYRKNTPKAVTPRFVADASQYALKHGWNPDANISQFHMQWRNDAFRVTRDPTIQVRREETTDEAPIHVVNKAAFETHAEAALVDALRAEVGLFHSFLAEVDGRIVGHILLTPVDVVDKANWRAMALGPMAVLPEYQRHNVGSQLIHNALRLYPPEGHNVVFVLGHPEYYPRFGFRRMSEFGITCEFEAPDDVLMVTELTPGAIAGRTGEVRYHPLFKTV